MKCLSPYLGFILCRNFAVSCQRVFKNKHYPESILAPGSLTEVVRSTSAWCNSVASNRKRTPSASWEQWLKIVALTIRSNQSVCGHWPADSTSAEHTPGSASPWSPRRVPPWAACSWACCRVSSADTPGHPSPASGSRSHPRGTCGSCRRRWRTCRWPPARWCSGSSGASAPPRAQSRPGSCDSAAAGTDRWPCRPALGIPPPPRGWCCRRRRATCWPCRPCWRRIGGSALQQSPFKNVPRMRRLTQGQELTASFSHLSS